jgi:hypothetical protein
MTSRPVSPETSNSLIRAWLGLYKNCPFRAILGSGLAGTAEGTEVTILCEDIPKGIRAEDNEQRL